MKVKVKNALVDGNNQHYVILPPVEVIQAFEPGAEAQVRVTPVPNFQAVSPTIDVVTVVKYYKKLGRHYVVLPIVKVAFKPSVGDIVHVKVTPQKSLPLPIPKFKGKFIGGPGLVRRFATTAALLPKIRGLRFTEEGLVVEMFGDDVADWAMLRSLFDTLRSQMAPDWVTHADHQHDDVENCGTCESGTCGCGPCQLKRVDPMSDPTLRMLLSH
ncbi:MAG: hypothetical protein KC468_34735 [Myxococcales bacterium]|nr:hypothetical protein [Myxococcales bacterium]